MKVDFKIVVHESKDWREAVNLREEILRKPLGSFFTEDELKEEEGHIHVIGKLEGKIIATAVLVPENKKIKMQRVVVSDELRSLNIGSKMMDFCEGYVRDEGFNWIYCHARNSAVNFYLRNAYEGEGDYFDEDGIPHLKMSKSLVLKPLETQN